MTEPTAEQLDSFINDAEGFLAAKAAQPTKRTLLETWRIVMGDVENAMLEKPGWHICARIIRDYPGASLKDVLVYHKLFHEKLLEMRDILDFVIASDPGCYKRVDDDMEENEHLYLSLLELWQQQLVQWELNWHPSYDDALMDMAASADAGNFFLGSKGLIAHLDPAGFVLNEADADSVFAAVNGQ